MSDSTEDDEKARYLDSHVYGLMVVSKNCTVPVHQTVPWSGKRKFCWQVPTVFHRKYDTLAGFAVRDRVPLAVDALRNVSTRGWFLELVPLVAKFLVRVFSDTC